MDNLTADLFSSQTLGVSSLLTIIVTMVLALVLGCAIAWVYRRNYRGVMFSGNFTLTLIMMTLITAPVVLCIKNSVALSMGMVGALSIVRFRTAIKEPMDIAFLFWSIAAGIVLAAGMIPLALIGSVAIGAIMILMVNRKSAENPYIAVIRCRDHASEIVAAEYLRSHVSSAQIKSKSAQESMIELNYEVRLKGDDTDFISALSDQQGVISAVLVSYNGDYMG